MSFDPSREPSLDNVPTSPTMPTDPGIVRTPKQFSDSLTLDLTDEEIAKAMQITLAVRRKWSAIFRSKFGPNEQFSADAAFKLLGQFEDEIKTRLAEEMDLLASVDVEPVLFGQPPVITFEGALGSHSSAKYGLDHEKKEWEVKRAKARGDDFLGIETIGE